jgi:tRNA 2-thiouridine synthesizing protein B
MLHIVNKSPLERNALDSCLRAAQGGALLLTEDAVYAATRGNAAAGKDHRRHGRHEGLCTRPRPRCPRHDRSPDRGRYFSVDYGGFVDLVAEYPTNQSWL